MRLRSRPSVGRAVLLLVAALLVSCADPGAAPGDRPDADGCVAFFNEAAEVGAVEDRDARVSGQSRWEWEGRQAVCWVTLLGPDCVFWSAMEPDWEWASFSGAAPDCETLQKAIEHDGEPEANASLTSGVLTLR